MKQATASDIFGVVTCIKVPLEHPAGFFPAIHGT